MSDLVDRLEDSQRYMAETTAPFVTLTLQPAEVQQIIAALSGRDGVMVPREKLEPFARALNVIDALPTQFKPSDEEGLRDMLPGIWPTLGDLRSLISASPYSTLQKGE